MNKVTTNVVLYPERKILLTIYVYEHESADLDLGNVLLDLDCSFFSPCELLKRTFSIATNANYSDAECAEFYVNALKATGLNIGKYEFTTVPED